MVNFSSKFYVGNRSRLAKSLPDSLLVISAHSMLQYSADTAYPFRQDSNFWYLTGINEPDYILLIDTSNNKSTILTPELNQYQKEWEGGLNNREIKKISGIDEIGVNSELTRSLKKAKKRGLQICYQVPVPELVEPYGFYSNPARKKLESQILEIEAKPRDVRKHIARLRMIKQPNELKAIKEAIKLTANAMQDVKKNLKKYKTEKEIERRLSEVFYGQADGHGFEPIVASGKNAATIHHIKNESPLKQGLLLLDIGARVGMYAADISRTWAAGKPTKRQVDIYSAVLDVHNNALNRYKAGVLLKEQQELVNKDLRKHYKKLGITDRDLPNGISHFLGIDIHDAGVYDEPLPEGSVVSIEPGIYLPEEGIGVRIEDDVLIKKNGIENLSSNIPYTL